MRLKKHLIWFASPLLAVALLAVSLPTLVHASPGPPVVSTTSLPNGEVGVAYTQTLGATDGTTPYTWSVTTGALPDGLALDGATGTISGTPTTAGSVDFTVQVTDSASPAVTASQALTIVVSDPVAVTTTTLADGEVGAAYSQALAATGGVAPYGWSVSNGALPDGLALDGMSGVISGTPTTAGTTTFTVQVGDAAGGIAAQAITFTVAPAVAITTTSIADGTAGSAYSETLGATGGVAPYGWSITANGLPVGLALDGTTGVISGTPALDGVTTFTVQVIDGAGGAAAQNLTITVAPAATLTVTSTALADGTIGAAYSQTLTASGGLAPYAWSITAGALPAGLTLDATTGVISGTPTAAGATTITVQVTDSATTPATATADLSITVGTTSTDGSAAVLAACQDTTTHPALSTLCRIYTSGQLPPFAQGVIGRVILKLADAGHPKGHKGDDERAEKGDKHHGKASEAHGKLDKAQAKLDKAQGKLDKTQSKLDKQFGVGVFFHANANSGNVGSNIGFGAFGQATSGGHQDGHGGDD